MRHPLRCAGLRRDGSARRVLCCACVTAGAVFATGYRPALGQIGQIRASHPPAPPVADAAARQTSVLVGIVADSLHGGPLAGAVVMLDGQPREATTDSTGRFEIDSIAAGKYRVGIFHPIFDSLGMALTSAPIDLAPGAPAVLALATPSGRAIRKTMCPDVPEATRPGAADTDVAVLVGHVLDPDTDDPVVDAHVTLSWTEIVISRTTIRNTAEQRDAITDRSGEFRFCALPRGVAGLLRASPSNATDTSVSVERELDLGSRIVTMTTLHLPNPRADTPAPASSPAPPDVAAAPAKVKALPRLAVLTGRVERPDGQPLPGASALVEGTSDSASASNDGTFTIRHLPSGTHMVLVRYVGFEPVEIPVELTRRAPQTIVVAMKTPTYVLNPVVVQAQRLAQGYARVGFDQRKHIGVGQFMTLADIERRHAMQVSDLFTAFRGLSLTEGGPGGRDLMSSRGTGGCVVYVLDGMPFNRELQGELDAMYQPDALAGIEVYTPAAVPEQFRVRSLPGPNEAGVPTLGTTGCTTVVIWTKTRLGLKY